MKKLTAIIALLLVAALMLPSCSTVNTGSAVMEYEGTKMGEKLYSFWVARYKRNILNYYSDVENTDTYWDSEYTDGMTVGEYFTGVIDNQIKNILIAQKLFKEYGLKLSDSAVQAIDDDINEKIEYAGSRAALNSELAKIGINIDILKEAYLWEARHDAVYNYLFGTGGKLETTSAQLESYYKEYYSRIHYIVLYTTKLVTDSDGNLKYDTNGNVMTEDMTEEEKAAVLSLADRLTEEAKSTDNFLEMVEEYSDYNYLEAYANGLFISHNEVSSYGYDIVGEVQKAKPGEVVRIDDDYAVYIIREFELTDFNSLGDADLSQISQIESYCAEDLYRRHFEALAENVTVNSEIYQLYDFEKLPPSPSSKY